jgi:hypothetical protein
MGGDMPPSRLIFHERPCIHASASFVLDLTGIPERLNYD